MGIRIRQESKAPITLQPHCSIVTRKQPSSRALPLSADPQCLLQNIDMHPERHCGSARTPRLVTATNAPPEGRDRPIRLGPSVSVGSPSRRLPCLHPDTASALHSLKKLNKKTRNVTRRLQIASHSSHRAHPKHSTTTKGDGRARPRPRPTRTNTNTTATG